MDDEDPDDTLVEIITASGFSIVPLQAVIDALAEMEAYICMEADVAEEELDGYVNRIEELLGREEAMSLSLDEIVSWIRAIRGH